MEKNFFTTENYISNTYERISVKTENGKEVWHGKRVPQKDKEDVFSERKKMEVRGFFNTISISSEEAVDAGESLRFYIGDKVVFNNETFEIKSFGLYYKKRGYKLEEIEGLVFDKDLKKINEVYVGKSKKGKLLKTERDEMFEISPFEDLFKRSLFDGDFVCGTSNGEKNDEKVQLKLKNNEWFVIRVSDGEKLEEDAYDWFSKNHPAIIYKKEKEE